MERGPKIFLIIAAVILVPIGLISAFADGGGEPSSPPERAEKRAGVEQAQKPQPKQEEPSRDAQSPPEGQQQAQEPRSPSRW